MVRAPKIDKNGVKKGAWSEEEDNKLRDYVTQHGHWNWRQLPKLAGLSRCGKSCRLRWVNYLRPNIKIGNYTKEEDDLIIKLRNELGNKWSAIAKKLPGRSDNEIKNHWHSHLKNRPKQNLITLRNESSEDTPQINVNQDLKKSTAEASSGSSNSTTETTSWTSNYATNFDYAITSSSSLSSNCLDFDWFLHDCVASSELFAETIDSFWKDPFLRYDEFMAPLVTEFFSPPSPVVDQELLWSYDQ